MRVTTGDGVPVRRRQALTESKYRAPNSWEERNVVWVHATGAAMGGHGLAGGPLEADSVEWVKAHPNWSREELARRSCLDMLMERFGIDAAMVSVPKLARALGMSRSTIYAALKAEAFFIPHRMIGRAPMFTIDDLVSWYRGGDVEAARAQIPAALEEREDVSLSEKGRRDRAVDDLVARATASVAKARGLG